MLCRRYTKNCIGVDNSMRNPQNVIIDCNMVDRFCEINVDPVTAFKNSRYILTITNDVKREIECLINAVNKRLERPDIDDNQKQIEYEKKI